MALDQDQSPQQLSWMMPCFRHHSYKYAAFLRHLLVSQFHSKPIIRRLATPTWVNRVCYPVNFHVSNLASSCGCPTRVHPSISSMLSDVDLNSTESIRSY